MKKSIALFLSLMLLLSCAATAETATNLTGDWYGSLYGMNITLTLNDDGSYAISTDGSIITDGSWESEEGKLYMDRNSEAETIFSIGEDAIGSEEEGVIFGREPIAEIVLPKPVPASAMSDFNGVWKLSIMSGPSMTIDAVTAQEALGEELSMQNTDLIITNGVASIFGGIEETLSFEDGKLFLTGLDENGDVVTQVVELTEDGGVVFTLVEDGIQVYFTK